MLFPTDRHLSSSKVGFLSLSSAFCHFGGLLSFSQKNAKEELMPQCS
jgi:hypothetical protein